MTLKNYLIVMGLLSILAWGIFILILNIIDPLATNWLGLSLFYVSLFLSLSSTAALLGFFVRFVALRHSLVFYAVSNAFRQSFLFALFISISFLLLSLELFTWLNISLLLIIFVILELFVTSYRRQKYKKI
ncbi:MAG: hypothetical protein RBT30_00540 [Patescibacteria group bacterium]|jgi:hypothetical protein|nr:hypothetical protein [Patescibacteria group bacterium]